MMFRSNRHRVIWASLTLSGTCAAVAACSGPSNNAGTPQIDEPAEDGGAGEDEGGPSRRDAESGVDGATDGGMTASRAYHVGEYIASDSTPKPHEAVLTLASGTSTTLQLGSFKPSVGLAAVSPDGKRMAMLGRDGASYLLRVFPLDAQGLPEVGLAVSVALPSVRETPNAARIRFSPDGTKIAFSSDHASAAPDLFQLYVVPSTGGTPVAVTAASNVTEFYWIKESRLFFHTVEPLFPCYRADAPNYVSEQLQTRCASAPKVDGIGRTYFLTRSDTGIYAVRRLVGDVVEEAPVPGTRLMNQYGEFCSVGGIAISPQGTDLAFSCASPIAGQNEIWVLDLAKAQAKKVTDFGVSPPGGGIIHEMAWHPQAATIVVRAQGDLYAVPAAGGPHVKLVTRDGLKAIYDFAFGRDGTLWLNGTLLEGPRAGLFATSSLAAEQAPSSIARFSSPNGSVFSFEVANRSDL